MKKVLVTPKKKILVKVVPKKKIPVKLKLKTLHLSLKEPNTYSMEPILYALKEYGTMEFSEGSNPQVEKYYKSCTDKETTDDVPWCSAFVNWCAKQAGAERSKSLSARSWLSVGKEVKTPKFGDVIVMWRGSKNDGVTGHVAFYVSTNVDGTFNCLSGNQGDMVNISKYPATKLLGFRRIY